MDLISTTGAGTNPAQMLGTTVYSHRRRAVGQKMESAAGRESTRLRDTCWKFGF